MFNLIVLSGGWAERRDEVPTSRLNILEDQVPLLRKVDGTPNFKILQSLPTIFAGETDHRDPNQTARVGFITSIRPNGSSYLIEYRYEERVPPIPQSDLIELAPALNIHIPRRGLSPLSTTHWSIKEADLFHVLLTEWRRPLRTPNVFNLNDPQRINNDLLSAMMPFAGFDGVWSAIQAAAENNGMTHGRADNRWDHPAIIQDVVSLIDESAIVVCDCSNKNANVFYEMGIAHSLGKEVIIITQNANDIPFDIAHLRHIRYLNNGEGLNRLEQELTARVAAIRTR